MLDHIVKPGVKDAFAYATDLGVLYKGDCLALFPCIQDESIDTIFADPPLMDS